MDIRTEPIPGQTLGSIVAAARNRREDTIDDEDGDTPAKRVYTPKAAVKTEPATLNEALSMLGRERYAELVAAKDKERMLQLIDWALNIDQADDAPVAVFHTQVGKIKLQLLQFTYVQTQNLYVLMLGDLRDVSYFPDYGLTLDFSIESKFGLPLVEQTNITVVSGPWSMRNFPIAFLMLWRQDTPVNDESDDMMVKDAKDRTPLLRAEVDRQMERKAASVIAANVIASIKRDNLEESPIAAEPQ